MSSNPTTDPRPETAPRGGEAVEGSLFVVSAPSGAGKTSLVRALIEIESDVVVSVSHTTRERRARETDGVDYHFVDRARFEAMRDAGQFLEWARVFNNLYGTSSEAVREQLGAGRDVILEIDCQGARQVRALVPESVGIFVLPPSLESLAERLHARGQDTETTIATRLENARAEIAQCASFDYIILNDQFDRALADLRAVVRGRALARDAQLRRHAALIEAMSRS